MALSLHRKSLKLERSRVLVTVQTQIQLVLTFVSTNSYALAAAVVPKNIKMSQFFGAFVLLKEKTLL